MIELLFAQLVAATQSPEALINAAIASKAAEQAASQASVISLFILGLIAIQTIALVFVALNFKRLEQNTDGMKEQLVAATRKLALIEGNVIGRAEQTAERANKAPDYKEAARETKAEAAREIKTKGSGYSRNDKRNEETTTTIKEQLAKDEPISIVAEIKEIKPETQKPVK